LCLEINSYYYYQHCYVLKVLQRFANPTSHCSLPPFCDTPAPPEYICFSVSNQPPTQEEQDEITTKYPDLDFCSCLCTILYLAYSTHANILFIVCKLCKSMLRPYLLDFHALFWLLSNLCKFPAYGICFYSMPNKSPMNQLLTSNFQQCVHQQNHCIFHMPAGKTAQTLVDLHVCGRIVLYHGSVIAAQSHVPLPVAMSSANV
jgi:hypothetical protein